MHLLLSKSHALRRVPLQKTGVVGTAKAKTLGGQPLYANTSKYKPGSVEQCVHDCATLVCTTAANFTHRERRD